MPTWHIIILGTLLLAAVPLRAAISSLADYEGPSGGHSFILGIAGRSPTGIGHQGHLSSIIMATTTEVYEAYVVPGVPSLTFSKIFDVAIFAVALLVLAGVGLLVWRRFPSRGDEFSRNADGGRTVAPPSSALELRR